MNQQVKKYLNLKSNKATRRAHSLFINRLVAFVSSEINEPEELIDFGKIYATRIGYEILYLPADIKICQDFMNYRKELGDTAHTLNATRYALRVFFNHLLQEGVVSENPALALRPIKESQVIKERLTIDEACSMLMVARKYDSNFMACSLIIVLLLTGLRAGEIEKAQENDIEPERGFAFIKGKTRDQFQPLLDVALAALRIHIQKSAAARLHFSAKVPLFIQDDGSALSAKKTNQILKELAMKAGINKEVTVHTLRRTYAQFLYNNGLRDTFLMEAMRHVKLYTTMKSYIKIDQIDRLKKKISITVTGQEVRKFNNDLFSKIKPYLPT